MVAAAALVSRGRGQRTRSGDNMEAVASSLLLGTSDEAAMNIASHLDSACDLVCLGRACKRYSLLCICAPPPERPWGRLLQLNADVQVHLLTKPQVVLGRSRLHGVSCDVLLPDVNHYSRRHCVLTRRVRVDARTELATLTNLSSNGTWVHPRGARPGTRIFRDEEVELRDGDEFSLVLPADHATEKFGGDAAVFKLEDGAALPEPPVERLSMVEEAARKWLERIRPEHLAWVPRRGQESHIGRMREVQQLLPGLLRLHPRHATIDLSEDGFRATSKPGPGYRGVATSAVLRAGRHYAECMVDVMDYMFFGLLRADVALTGGAHGEDPVDHPGGIFYSTENGACWNASGEVHWHGMKRAVPGDMIGLLWDRSAGGRLEVFKNGRRLGVMQDSGLCEEYRWCVALFNRGDTAQIEAKEAPPTVSEHREVDREPEAVGQEHAQGYEPH